MCLNPFLINDIDEAVKCAVEKDMERIIHSGKILVCADFHHATDEDFEKIKELKGQYSACFCLGDIKVDYLQGIREATKTIIYYILGNHDGAYELDPHYFTNLDGKVIEKNGIKFAEFGGSFRYKNGDYPMLTQEESVKFAKELPQADVLLSHDSPYGLYSKNQAAHIGLKGITQYLKKNKVKLNIHGHQHQNKHLQIKNLFGKALTDVIGVYRCAIVDLNTLEVEQILN